MTDETKKLFDAPWTVKHHVHACWEVDFEISTVDRMSVAVSPAEEHANRIARLPELYDALNKQAYYRCVDCLRHTANTIDDIPLNRDMIEHGCPKNRTDCGAFDAWTLLKKVKDGK